MKLIASTGARGVLRSVLVACIAGLVLPLLGATTPTLINAPVIVIFPLVGAQGVAPDVGSGISVVLATQIAQLGGITVKPAPPGTQQADFLTTAQKLGTDYYISGFVSPLGDQVSVVEQLVSTRGGSVVWSNTSQIAVYGDARASGTALHDTILQYAGRGFSTLDQAHVVPTATPAPVRRSKPAPEAVAPVALNAAPSLDLTGVPNMAAAGATGKTATILEFDGQTQQEIKNYVPAAVVRSLRKYGYQGARAEVPSEEVAKFGQLICAQSGSDLLLAGSVQVNQGEPELGWAFDAVVKMTGYDCANLAAKPRKVQGTASNGNTQTAIDIAVAKALKDYMNPKFTSLR